MTRIARRALFSNPEGRYRIEICTAGMGRFVISHQQIGEPADPSHTNEAREKVSKVPRSGARVPRALRAQRVAVRFIVSMERLAVKRLPEGPDGSYEIKLDGFRLEVVKAEGGTTCSPGAATFSMQNSLTSRPRSPAARPIDM